MGSAAWQLPAGNDWKKIGMGAVIAFVGFAITWLTTDFIPHIDQNNTGGMLAVAAAGIIVNFLRKWLADTTQPPAPPTPPSGTVQ